VPGDLEVALAFVARREGRRAMPAARWAHVLSLDLGWMPPAQARAFVEQGVSAALLRAEGESLVLAVDPATVEVPRGFRPGAQPVPAPPRPAAPAAAAQAPAAAPVDPFLEWVERVAAATGSDRRRVLAQVADAQARMGGMLSAMAAVLWLAARAGLDAREAAAAAAATA
jgi:hypothetical protein